MSKRVLGYGFISGMLTVIKFDHSLNCIDYWYCECSCGGTKLANANGLLNNVTRHCGCLKKDKPIKIKDIKDNGVIGKKFGQWEVLRKGNGGWYCICHYGHTQLFLKRDIKKGLDYHCKGCTNKLPLAKHPLYGILIGIKKRCYQKGCKDYGSYGAKGVMVSESWMKNGWNFINDMGERPSLKHTVDRIDNNGNYCKENCRWATPKEQANNKSNSRRVNYFGVNMSIYELSALVGVSYGVIYYKITNGLPLVFKGVPDFQESSSVIPITDNQLSLF